jgi:tetratricopeptide (TPR) repeat protein
MAAISLHLIFLTHAGGLWRDEATIVNGSAMTLSELWQNFTLVGSPLYVPLALRGWSALAGGHSDFVFRAHGFVVGIALLGALWFNAWAMGRQLPLLSLGLLAVNATFVRWGDTVRGYGSSLVFMLVMLGLLWRLTVKPDGRRFALAAGAAVLSVQAQLQNATLLLAMCGAGCLACLRRRDWRASGLIVSVGLVAALTLVPYVPNILHSQEWWALPKTGLQPGWVWSNVISATGSPCSWLAIVWLVMVLLAVGMGIGAARHADWPDSDLKLFAASALALGIGCFLVFLWVAGLPTQVWYYLLPMTLSAACINAVLPTKLGHLRALRLAVVGLLILLPYPESAGLARWRLTNLDLVAARLQAEAGPEDLIAIHPWYCGVTFNRYYHGKAPWLTVPPMDDYRLQRIDLLRERMLAEDPLGTALTRAADTLASGHRLWLVGWFTFNGQLPARLPKPPHGPQGWYEAPYEAVWAQQFAYLVVTRAGKLERIYDGATGFISPYENLPIYLAQGRRTNESPAQAYYDLALVLDSQQRTAEAATNYTEALRREPDLPAALNNLAWIRAANPRGEFRDGAEAVRLAERACRLTEYREPMLMGTLGAAYAEAGRFDEAVAMAARARDRARELGQSAVAEKNEELIRLFTARQPYRAP